MTSSECGSLSRLPILGWDGSNVSGSADSILVDLKGLGSSWVVVVYLVSDRCAAYTFNDDRGIKRSRCCAAILPGRPRAFRELARLSINLAMDSP